MTENPEDIINKFIEEQYKLEIQSQEDLALLAFLLQDDDKIGHIFRVHYADFTEKSSVASSWPDPIATEEQVKNIKNKITNYLDKGN